MAQSANAHFDYVRSESCETKLELNLKVSKLRNYDLVGQSDPFCVVYVNNTAAAAIPPRRMQQPPLQHHPSDPRRIFRVINNAVSNATAALPALPNPIGRPKFAQRKLPWQLLDVTETVHNSLDASFATPIKVSYFFERAQQVAIDVYDADSPSQNFLHHDYLGSAEFMLSSLVRADGQCLKLRLRMESHPERQCGFVTVIGEDKGKRRFLLKMDVGLTLKHKPFFMSTSYTGPFLHIYRLAGKQEGEWMHVYKSKTAARRERLNSSRHSYVFDAIRTPFERLSLAKESTRLRFAISYKVRHKQREVAATIVTLEQWRASGGIVDLHHPDIVRRGLSSRPCGSLVLRTYNVTEEPQFMDYIMGGCEMSLVIGIDFTASNGDSAQPNSLHFLDSYHSNEYECAIRAVGEILAEYDSTQQFPAYGFGAKVPPAFDRVSHCFTLTGADDPICYKIDGVLTAYRKANYMVRLSGPTQFSQLIDTAARHADYMRQKHAQAYTILLILTDGVINDFDETSRSIADASWLPLSIVIIGVGAADFSAMNALDGDDFPLNARMARDIVQFVPFRKYQNSPDLLLSEVLAEIPNQVVEYFMMKGMRPNPKKQSGVGSPPTHIVNNPSQAVPISQPQGTHHHLATTSAHFAPGGSPPYSQDGAGGGGVHAAQSGGFPSSSLATPPHSGFHSQQAPNAVHLPPSTFSPDHISPTHPGSYGAPSHAPQHYQNIGAPSYAASSSYSQPPVYSQNSYATASQSSPFQAPIHAAPYGPQYSGPGVSAPLPSSSSSIPQLQPQHSGSSPMMYAQAIATDAIPPRLSTANGVAVHSSPGINAAADGISANMSAQSAEGLSPQLSSSSNGITPAINTMADNVVSGAHGQNAAPLRLSAAGVTAGVHMVPTNMSTGVLSGPAAVINTAAGGVQHAPLMMVREAPTRGNSGSGGSAPAQVTNRGSPAEHGATTAADNNAQERIDKTLTERSEKEDVGTHNGIDERLEDRGQVAS